MIPLYCVKGFLPYFDIAKILDLKKKQLEVKSEMYFLESA